jgi:hypothetical protein
VIHPRGSAVRNKPISKACVRKKSSVEDVLATSVIAERCAGPKTAATYAYSAMFMALFQDWPLTIVFLSRALQSTITSDGKQCSDFGAWWYQRSDDRRAGLGYPVGRYEGEHMELVVPTTMRNRGECLRSSLGRVDEVESDATINGRSDYQLGRCGLWLWRWGKDRNSGRRLRIDRTAPTATTMWC